MTSHDVVARIRRLAKTRRVGHGGTLDPMATGVADAEIHSGRAAQRGEIDQVPSAVSAIKINGERAYKRVRDGETVELPARRVTVARLDVLAIRRSGDLVDVDIDVDCSSGT